MLEEHFPAPISCLACSEELVLCAGRESSHWGPGPATPTLTVFHRGVRTATCSPHTDLIRAVRLQGTTAFSCSNDCSIAVVELAVPSQPAVLHRLQGHNTAVCSIDISGGYLGSLSTEGRVGLWHLAPAPAPVRWLAGEGPALRLALSWPLAASGGRDRVWLWNLQTGQLLRLLAAPPTAVLSVLDLSRAWCVMGDQQGRLALWSVPDLLESVVTEMTECSPSPAMPARVMQVASPAAPPSATPLLSAVRLEQRGLLTAGWAGRVTRWTFH